jgi:ribulose-phosphate 3-epimerase
VDAVLDVHLMVSEPEKWIQPFRDAGADALTIHAEATNHLHRVLQQIRASGALCGVAINPATPISVLEHVGDLLDIVLVMTVNPGFGGQKFIDNTYKKIKDLRSMASGRNNDLLIEIDGGVSNQNALKLLQAGANVLVAGNSVFSAIDPLIEIATLKNLNPDLIGG